MKDFFAWLKKGFGRKQENKEPSPRELKRFRRALMVGTSLDATQMTGKELKELYQKLKYRGAIH